MGEEIFGVVAGDTGVLVDGNPAGGGDFRVAAGAGVCQNPPAGIDRAGKTVADK